MNAAPHGWSPAEDYAIAFASGLGMSNAQIARSLGAGFTRNMVIGRRHRLGLGSQREVSAKKPKVLNRAPIAASVSPNAWTDLEIETIRTNCGMAAKELARLLPRRTPSAIQAKRHSLGILKRPRFTAYEDGTLATLFNQYAPVEEIAAKIGRDVGTTRQRIFHLGLRRDGRKTKLARRFGLDALSLSDDPSEARAILLRRQREAQDRAEAEKQRVVHSALDLMVVGIQTGNDRRAEMQAAMLAGATLQQVGDRLNLTRERIRQIVHDVRSQRTPRPPKHLTCAGCGGTFVHDLKGRPKRCLPCREAAHEETRKRRVGYMRSYMAELRKTEKYKKYKREWTRRDRLKAKLLTLSPEDLAATLRDVADRISSN